VNEAEEEDDTVVTARVGVSKVPTGNTSLICVSADVERGINPIKESRSFVAFILLSVKINLKSQPDAIYIEDSFISVGNGPPAEGSARNYFGANIC